MKKAIIIFACLVLVLSLASCRRTHQDYPDAPSSNTDGPTKDFVNAIENPKTDFQFEISSNGEGVYINKYIGASKNVVIPSKIDGLPVVSIKGVVGDFGIVQEGAFEGCDIQSVTIPQSVTGIGLCAFKDCKELVQITIPENLEMLADSAFQNCKKLKMLDLSTTKLLVLASSTFVGCVELKKIVLPQGLTEIQEKAFLGCSSLLEILLPEGLTRVGEAAFADCTALKTITIPIKLDMFVMRFPVFSNMPKLETIIFQEGREEISGYAFFDITSNVEIIIPKSVKTFSSEPFFIRGPAKITFLGDCPEIVGKSDFYGEPTVYYDPEMEGWVSCIWKKQYALKPIE